MTNGADQILAKFDQIAADGNWPRFEGGIGVFEYHAMRLIAVRERGGDDDWGVAFEVVQGDFVDDPAMFNAYAANVSTYLVVPSDSFGIRKHRPLELRLEGPEDRNVHHLSIEGLKATGPAGLLELHDSMLTELDLRPGMLCGPCDGGAADAGAVLAIRAYLAKHPNAFWGDPLPYFVAPCDVLLECYAFQHEPDKPSSSETFRSLAAALAARDASLFRPGPSNLDWRKWAIVPDGEAITVKR